MTAGRIALDAGFAALLQQWGKAATYTHADGAAVAVTVIFGNASELLEPVSGVTVNSTAPMAQGWTDDFPERQAGDLLVVDGIVYEVLRGEEPDGEGITNLYLSKDTTRSFLQNEAGLFILNQDGSMIEIVL